MSSSSAEIKVIQRVPFWLAVALTVVISIPFGVFLGPFNIALWSSFIVWAEYFVFGATYKALKHIYFISFRCSMGGYLSYINKLLRCVYALKSNIERGYLALCMGSDYGLHNEVP